MKKIRTVPEQSLQHTVLQRLVRKQNAVRAGTRRLAACLAATLFVIGNMALPANAEELPEEIRGYTAEEIAISGTDGDSITQENSNAGVHVTKTLRNNGDGSLQIQLESWVSGTTRTQYQPSDVVLVLDTSTSMELPMPGAANRLEALKSAANSFITAVEQQNQGIEESVQSRIAIVNYSSAEYSGIRQHLTRADATGAASMRSVVSGLTQNGITRMDVGLGYAQQIMNQESDPQRKRAVILFTDGVPNTEGTSGFLVSFANKCLATSRSMKESGIEVFAITSDPNTVVNPGDPMPTFSPIGRDDYLAKAYFNSDYTGEVNTSDENGLNLVKRYMELLSSNNPHAQDLNTPNAWNGGDAGSTRGEKRDTYYYTTSEASSLASVFRTIAEEVNTADSELNGNTEARDTIQEPFYRDTSEPVQVCVAEYQGNGSWGTPRDITGEVSVSDADNKVVVKGFDYGANYVSENPRSGGGSGSTRGSKLIISFRIKPQATFGGNQLPTNGSSSGIYKDAGTGTPEVLYPIPSADLKPRYLVQMQDQNIYVPDKAYLDQLILQSNVWKPDGSKNRNVNISYTLTDHDGAVKGTLNVPAGQSLDSCSWNWNESETDLCGQYLLTCKAEPVASGHFGALTVTDSGNVHVFHPELDFQDSTLYQGDPVDVTVGDSTDSAAFGEHLLNLSWKCPDGTTSQKENEPRLGYRITIPQGVQEVNGQTIIQQKEPLSVIAGIYREKDGSLGEDITSQAEFTQTCSRKNCTYDKETDGKVGVRFLIHVIEKPMQEKVDLPNTGGEGIGRYVLIAVGLAVAFACGKGLYEFRKHRR